MVDQNDRPDALPSAPDTTRPQRYQLDVATNVVPMQRDHLGRPFWESYMTPASYEVWAEARIPPDMPGVIIFVHGVNSEGEWYDAAEKALCEGLNVRLGRTDENKLEANEYSNENDERRLPRRRIAKMKNSPVVRFYWGYRSDDVDLSRWKVALRNIQGNDFWALQCSKDEGPWYWGGGPFQNGTNNLQQLWSERGFSRTVYGFDMQRLNTEVERQLQDAPPRRYYAHAAQRLANLVDTIREEYPGDTVSLVSHSQGTMIAMAATLLCKKRAPDAVFVMNSPFAMEDKMTDAITCGRERPTSDARANTFRAVANRIKSDKRVWAEDMLKQVYVGVSQDMQFWRPDLKNNFGIPERDNHGRLYVYFTPHDRVMGATPLQSIGWQGVNDTLLASLGDTVKQRMLARSMPVGDEPGVRRFGTLPPIAESELVPGAKPADFWNGNRGVLGGLFGVTNIWAVPNANQPVTINAEKVPNPLTADEMTSFEESRAHAREYGLFVMDKKDPGKGHYQDPTFPYYRSIHQPERYLTRDDAYLERSGTTLESRDEMIERISNYKPEPTNHSTLPMHAEFMKRVVAWDLPVGFCDAHEDREFWHRLIRMADWTSGWDSYFDYGTLESIDRPGEIDWTSIAEELSQAEAKRIQYGKNYRGS